METMEKQQNFLPKFFSFMRDSYEPGLHFGFAALWFLGLIATFVSINETPLTWVLSGKTLFAILTLFLVLFVLRCVDEIKDYEYDKVHSPDRPLVVGSVTEDDLFAFNILSTVVVVFLNLFLSASLLAIALLDILYGIYLIWVERFSPKVRNSLYYSLLVTYPVNILLSVYTLFFFMGEYGAGFKPDRLWVILAFALAFLHYEFSRKNAWPQHAKAGQRLYSATLTTPGTLLISNLFALLAPLIILLVSKPWLGSRPVMIASLCLLLPYVCTLIGTVCFVRTRKKAKVEKKVLMPFANAYLVLFYLSLIVFGAVSNRVEFRFF